MFFDRFLHVDLHTRVNTSQHTRDILRYPMINVFIVYVRGCDISYRITIDSSNTAKYYSSPLPIEFQYISYVIEFILKGVVCNNIAYRTIYVTLV